MPGTNQVKTLQAVLDQAVQEQKIPGATACLMTPDYTWEFAAGVSSRRRRAAMRPRDRFRIASISKVYVATVLLQLYDEGVLDLDETLAEWLAPKVAERFPNPKKITIRHLLNHTSGLDDYLNTDGFSEATQGRPYDQPWRAWEAVRYGFDLEPLDKPGKTHHYSNTNYLLLDLIVETATGNPVYREIRTRLLEPLGLTDTFTETFEPVPGGFVEGYEDLDEDGRQDLTSGLNAGAGLADGGLISTAYDVARFSHTLFGPGSMTGYTYGKHDLGV
jgi:D-alanyl-D-alanine carboxypeptidase